MLKPTLKVKTVLRTSQLSIALFFVLIINSNAIGQDSGNIKRKFPEITLTLTPIVKHGPHYYFNGSRGTFESILLPLTALNDPGVDDLIKKSRITRKVGRAVTIAPVLYVFYDLSTSGKRVNVQRNRDILIGSLIAGQLLQFLEVDFKRRAVKRYNEVILQPQVWMTPGNSLGVGVQVKF